MNYAGTAVRAVFARFARKESDERQVEPRRFAGGSISRIDRATRSISRCESPRAKVRARRDLPPNDGGDSGKVSRFREISRNLESELTLVTTLLDVVEVGRNARRCSRSAIRINDRRERVKVIRARRQRGRRLIRTFVRVNYCRTSFSVVARFLCTPPRIAP